MLVSDLHSRKRQQPDGGMTEVCNRRRPSTGNTQHGNRGRSKETTEYMRYTGLQPVPFAMQQANVREQMLQQTAAFQ